MSYNISNSQKRRDITLSSKDLGQENYVSQSSTSSTATPIATGIGVGNIQFCLQSCPLLFECEDKTLVETKASVV